VAYHRVVPDRSVGVYVHVPFCERVCPYCDFAVEAARPLEAGREARYVDGLLAELKLRQEAFAGRRLASVYLGGGTPSLLESASIERILAGVASVFEAEGPVEVTLELNPSTVERERLPEFKQAGVNRLSVGVQSFSDDTLRRLGRAHRASEAEETLDASRAAGFASISIDLILAAPGQRLADLEQDLERALSLGPHHVSTYELTIEPATPFATAARRGQLDRAPEDEVAAMIETTRKRLTAAGFERYELSNYARPGHRSMHNQRYWQRRPVLGLGVGAFTTQPPGEGAPHGVRRSNRRDVAGYLEALGAGVLPEREPPEVLSPRASRGEAVFLALRTCEGLDGAAFVREFGAPPRGFFSEAIDRLVAQGLVEEGSDGALSLSARGRLLADTVFENFV
jgi:oxygen-independent coproporphyrinogen-3 oxidase